MAESEEFRLKRIKHEERLSRVFDEVMGLGEFADSSGGSASSSRSGGQDETKGEDETSQAEEHQQVEEEDSNGSRQGEKTKETSGESSFPRISTPSIRTNEGGGGGSGGAALDNAVDGLPSFEPDEEDEDWHFSLPTDSQDEANSAKANRKERQTRSTKKESGDNLFTPPPREEEEEGEQDREGSSGSANTSHSSQDPTDENSRDGGALNQTEETEDSQQGESEVAPMEDSNPPISPVNIKDEPIDEGYDAALLPQSSIRQIKEELEQQEEELRISSVYSVSGANTFATPTIFVSSSQVPAPVQAHPQTAFFIQGRGGVLQAMTSLPVRPPAPIPSSLPALAALSPRPPQPPVPGSVRCSGCSKVLLKGQTAFQRKGSTQLFCSTVCLTGHLPPTTKNRCCFQCNREIIQPRDMITIPADDSTFMHFCGQFCLSVFRHKRKQVDKGPDKWVDKRLERKPEKPPEKPAERQPDKPFCSVCKISNRQIEHEVTHQGRLHRLCSDACFVSWRKMRQLAMNCCEGCGLYCNSKLGSCQTLTIDRSQLNFCGPTCIGTYKQNCRKTVDCAFCRKLAIVSSTTMERDQKGKVQLYCSSMCVDRSRPPRHILTGTAFPCCQCRVSAVPQYHLAMVDGTIRNFCSYDCVSIFRKSGQIPPSDPINGTSSLRDPTLREASKSGLSVGAGSVPPIPQEYPSSVPHPGSHPSHSSVPPLVPSYSSPSAPGQHQAKASSGQPTKPAEAGLGDTSKLTCHQCSKHFNIKPFLFSNQGQISVFCSRMCSEQYKTQKNILTVCENCKQEKVLFETFNYNQQEVSFCSEGCKLAFKTGLQSHNKDNSWKPCSYCFGVSNKMLHSHYGGRIEEFCRAHCMSQYTVLYYGMGRCDSCRKQGYLNEKLQCLGSVRNFCHLTCLMEYCYEHFETKQHGSSNSTKAAPQIPCAPAQPQHSSKMNPVIAGVVSLANGSATQPSVTADTALTGALPTSNVDSKNLDHASTQTDALRVPAHRRRQMKNKSVLCRPFTMDQESMCQLPIPSSDSSDLPLSSVCSSAAEEKVKVIMVPVPVPVFIPVPMNMYSQHTPVPMPMPMPIPVPFMVPQSKEMKDAAVQSEPLAVTEEKQKDEPVSSADQSSSFSENTKSEVIAPIPRGAEETQEPEQAELPVTVSSEKITEPTDPQQIIQPEESTTTTSEAPTTSTEHQPPSSPMMDLESDFPSEVSGQKPAALQRGVKRPREAFSGRKRGRRRAAPLDRSALVAPVAPVAPATSKLNHVYGVKAWRSWVQQRSKQETSIVEIKEDIIECDSAELSFALSRFIKEVRRPNGEPYSPDSIFYLCLGIQQYLFMKGRIENIFTDELYSQFATEISGMLQLWRPKLLPGGGIFPSRVAESYLWECKQLGAYSPIVLLNTLLFFCTKSFRFNSLLQHRSLSFTNLTRASKPCSRAGKVHYLRHQRSSTATPRREEAERLRKKQVEVEGDLEMLENASNPLRCPLRLYEFYLSRCPESVKKRTDLFYLQPEQNVHTRSPYWYTSQPLEATTLQSMLTRILAVREVHQEKDNVSLQ
ncbi:zinc finger MYM-type protein 4-like isoform X2 [Notolabrus celidotus]|uniref:zinc finger MYM-type protein 4-like isoform X2 n=1 Tax=Notolabrus celidotus TaxID=1203425 RepID=UPI00148F5BB8|nr:zinc finger MYM-type protein 4-like isoform X2 [Notolabrus celidotus]